MAVLTGAHQEAIDHPAARLQVVACAGSGKTEVLARRAVRLLTEGVEPSEIIAFTFTEKADAELKSRIELRAAEIDDRFSSLPPVSRGMFIGTTHGWAFSALQKTGGMYETLDPLSAEQEWVLLHRFARRLGLVDLYAKLKGRASNTVAAAQAVDVFLRSIEVVHNEGIDPKQLEASKPEFAAVFRRYEWLLEKMRLLPFRLMITRATEELGDGGRLAARLKDRVKHVFVDEFQDFNRAQDRLLGQLAQLGADITVVADDDQAIYQWRGGDVSLFVQFMQRYQDAERVRLPKNHRSRPEIINFARHVVECLPNRLPKALDAAREAAATGAVEIAVAPTAESEAEVIADRIAKLIASGHRPAGVAALYRSVRTSARPLIEALRHRNIPVSVIGTTSLLARPEMALIARLFIYWAGGTWYPNPQFEPEVVTQASLIEEICSVAHVDRSKASRLLRRLEQLGAEIRREGVRDSILVFNRILVILGLPGVDSGAQWRELGLGQMSALLTDFDHVARRAAPQTLYEAQTGDRAVEAHEDAVLAADRSDEQKPVALGPTPGQLYLIRLKAFLEEFAGRAAEETPDTMPEAQNAVQVMTVHQAKGLEFPVVFVPSLVDGRFPSAMMGRRQLWYIPDALFDRARYEGREEDEARLLYVALTRAKELLVASWFQNHRAKRATVSRFVSNHLRSALNAALQLGRVTPIPGAHADAEELLGIDFSSLVSYAECAYRYWLREVCGFQPPLVPELGFGKLLHHIVAELARRTTAGQTQSESDVDQIIADAFYLPFAGPIPARNLLDSASRRSKAYLRNFGEELTRVHGEPEVPFEVPIGNARLRGCIDLMLSAGGADAVELIDFKTSANRPPSDIHMNQMRLYAAAVERLGFRPVKLAIHDLDSDGGHRMEVPRDGEQSAGFQRQLAGWVEGIRNGRFDPVKDRKACGTCDFHSFCKHAFKTSRAT
jgi:ATP-dependent DNA helicase UvrD/PcrA